MAKFETKVVLVNQYDEIVCELVKGLYWYNLPAGEALLLAVGDEYKVKEIEVEVE